MPKGQRLKPEQIVTLLRQIDVLTANGKTLSFFKGVIVRNIILNRARDIYGMQRGFQPLSALLFISLALLGLSASPSHAADQVSSPTVYDEEKVVTQMSDYYQVYLMPKGLCETNKVGSSRQLNQFRDSLKIFLDKIFEASVPKDKWAAVKDRAWDLANQDLKKSEIMKNLMLISAASNQSQQLQLCLNTIEEASSAINLLLERVKQVESRTKPTKPTKREF